MKVAVVGAGYVGLATAVGFAELGHSVVCAENDVDRLQSLLSGRSPVAEAGISAALETLTFDPRLMFVATAEEAVSHADVVFLCLPTPQGTDGTVDLSAVIDVVENVKDLLVRDAVLVLKSTVPPGTAARVSVLIDRPDINVVSNPEFLRQGTALEDFLRPDRIVIGGNDTSAVERVASLYRDIGVPILTMTTESAELLKYAANSFLATKLTFVNAIADICEAVGARIDDVVAGLSADSRIGAQFLRPGPGWGGSCFPKDTRALVGAAAARGYDFALLKGVIETNDSHYRRVADKVRQSFDAPIAGRRVAAWGLTFKAMTDDLRDSPAVVILRELMSDGVSVAAFDPAARDVERHLDGVELCSSPEEACQGADVLVVLTEWPMFADVDPFAVASVMNRRIVVDARNVLDEKCWIDAGFLYRGIGR